MALIVDPDLLADSAADDNSTEVYIDVAAKTIKLNTGVGDLVAADGVTLKAVYSFVKEEWTGDPLDKSLAAYPFPFVPLSDEFYILQEGWNWADAETRESIRSGGWQVTNTSDDVTEHWANIKAIGSIQGSDQLYYDNGTGSGIDFNFTGAVNEAVQVRSDPNGDGNYADGYDRSAAFTIFNRTRQRSYAQATLSDIGESNLLSPKSFSFAVGTVDDSTDITVADTGIDANSDGTADVAPYSGMSITWYGSAQQRNIGGTNYDFSIIIDGNNGTLNQIYEFVQWSLRQTVDIDAGAGSEVGKLTDALVDLAAGIMTTLQTSAGDGVYIDNFLSTDTNSLVFTDDTGTTRTFPFVAAGTIEFNSNLQNDASAEYAMYFTSANGNDWGTASAILVDNDAGSDIAGLVSSNASITFDFDYDGNVQGGRTAGTDAAVTVVAIGHGTAQHVVATSTITRSTTNVISLVAPLERNYANPA